MATETTQPEWWRNQGYIYGRPIGDGLWICIAPMAFTWRLMVCTESYVLEFYCYEDLVAAVNAAVDWDGREDPGGGWVKSNTREHGERWPEPRITQPPVDQPPQTGKLTP